MTLTMRVVGMLLVALCYPSLNVHAATKSSGCGKALPNGIKCGATGASNKLYITSNGIKRTYLLHIPQVYTPTRPHGLIFSFHGRGQDGAEQERLSQFSEAAFNPNMLVVYPYGIKQEWQGDPDASTDDVTLTLDLIKNVTSTYCIDEDKIFAAGKSNGGGFSANILACDPNASKKIAAFAGIAGAYYAEGHSDEDCKGATVPITCHSGRKPIPIFETHGSSDGVIPYNGGARRGACLPSIPHFMHDWAKRNGLSTANVTTDLYNGDVKEYRWGSQGLQGINTHYWIEGLGHSWPSTRPNDDGSGTYFNATPLIMDFFNKWTLSNTPVSIVSPNYTTLMSESDFQPATLKSSKISSAAASSTSSTSSNTPTIVCPAANGTTTTLADGHSYAILCAFDTTSAVMGSELYGLGSFGKCIDACDKTDGCEHVAYDGTCYLKKAVTKYVRTSSQVNRVAVRQH